MERVRTGAATESERRAGSGVLSDGLMSDDLRLTLSLCLLSLSLSLVD